MKQETFHMLIAAAFREGADHWIAGPTAAQWVANEAAQYADELVRKYADQLEPNE